MKWQALHRASAPLELPDWNLFTVANLPLVFISGYARSSTGGSVVEFSLATREAWVRFPASAIASFTFSVFFFFFFFFIFVFLTASVSQNLKSSSSVIRMIKNYFIYLCWLSVETWIQACGHKAR